VYVETPFPPEGFPTMLAVNLFIYSLFTFMDGSYMLCHVPLPGEHFLTVGAGNAFDSAMFGLSEVDMSNVRTQICLCGENPNAQVTSLVAWIVSKGRVTYWPRGNAIILLLNINSLNDWIHLLDILCDVLILRDVGGGGECVVGGQGHQLGR